MRAMFSVAACCFRTREPSAFENAALLLGVVGQRGCWRASRCSRTPPLFADFPVAVLSRYTAIRPVNPVVEV